MKEKFEDRCFTDRPQWIVWEAWHVHDPTCIRIMLARGDDGLDPWRMNNSKLQPSVITTIAVAEEDIGKPLKLLQMMDRYQLPISYLKGMSNKGIDKLRREWPLLADKTIPGEERKTIESKPKLTKDEADRLGVTVDGKPKTGA